MYRNVIVGLIALYITRAHTQLSTCVSSDPTVVNPNHRPNPPRMGPPTLTNAGCVVLQTNGVEACVGYYYDLSGEHPIGTALQCDGNPPINSNELPTALDCNYDGLQECYPPVIDNLGVDNNGNNLGNHGICGNGIANMKIKQNTLNCVDTSVDHYFCCTSFDANTGENQGHPHCGNTQQNYGPTNYPTCFSCQDDNGNPSEITYTVGLARCDEASSSSSGDPHLRFAHGGFADFRGENDTYVSLLSAPEIQMAGKTIDSNFMLKHGIEVDGSFFTSIAWTVRTTFAYPGLPNSLLNINIEADREAHVDISGAASASLRSKFQNWTVDDIRIEQRHLSTKIIARGWEMEATRKPVYNFIKGAKWRYDLKVKSIENEFTCYPHGIIGQSWDADKTDFIGKIDLYDNLKYIKTSAQAEGAIEGSYTRYILKHANDVNFKYQRFWKRVNEHCPPRNTSTLNGQRIVHEHVGYEAAEITDKS